jgi:hypothetical protein
MQTQTEPAAPTPTKEDQRIARKVRELGEEHRRRVEVLAEYLGMSCSLCGLCHLAAVTLTQVLVEAGLEAVVASDGHHSWTNVTVSTGNMLVDVTATQYGLAKVFIRLHPGQSRWRYFDKTIHEVKVSGPIAEMLCRMTIVDTVQSLPDVWWRIDPLDLKPALSTAGTKLAPAYMRKWMELLEA